VVSLVAGFSTRPEPHYLLFSISDQMAVLQS